MENNILFERTTILEHLLTKHIVSYTTIPSESDEPSGAKTKTGINPLNTGWKDLHFLSCKV